MQLRVPAIILASLVLAGCGRGAPLASSPLPVERIDVAGRQYTTQTSALRVVVRDQATWKALWAQTFRNVQPAPPLPFVNFEDEMIVMAALGEQPSGGYDIRVDEAFMDGVGTRVGLTISTPGRDCAVATVMTQPVDFARVPLRTGPLRFVEKRTAGDCN